MEEEGFYRLNVRCTVQIDAARFGCIRVTGFLHHSQRK